MIPQTKTTSLIEQINDAASNPKGIDSFTLKRFESEAKTLCKSQSTAAEGYGILGILAGLSRDKEGIHRNFQAALRLEPTRSLFAINYVVTLANMFYSKEALEIYDKYLENKNNPDIFIAGVLFIAGRYISANRILKKINYDETLHVVHGSITAEVVDRTAEMLITLKIDEQKIVNRIDAIEYMIKKNYGNIFGHVNYFALSEDGSVKVEYNLPVTIDQAVDLNFKIAEALVEKFDDSLLGFINYSVIPNGY